MKVVVNVWAHLDKLKLFVLMVLSSLKKFGNLIKKHIWRSPVIVKLQLDAYNFTKKDFFLDISW